MRHNNISMQSLRAYIFLLAVVACGGGAKQSTLPTKPASAIPADDLSAAKRDAAPVDSKDGGLVAKDPRTIDLDIIRITASGKGVGGESEMTSVASADLFRQANEAAKAGSGRWPALRNSELRPNGRFTMTAAPLSRASGSSIASASRSPSE